MEGRYTRRPATCQLRDAMEVPRGGRSDLGGQDIRAGPGPKTSDAMTIQSVQFGEVGTFITGVDTPTPIANSTTVVTAFSAPAGENEH
jgi:hypothetical protein